MGDLKKFRVRIGRHVDVTRKVYIQGDVVESEDDLMAKFPNKFTLVGREDPPDLDAILAADAAAMANEQD